MKQLVKVTEASTLDVVQSSPQYNIRDIDCGIMHLSLGGFHRSHQARYIHDYLQTHNEPWAIYSVGLMESDKEAIEALQAQDNIYTLIERSGNEDTVKIIGSIKSTVHAPSKVQFTIDRMSSDAIKIISLTITEKGYCYDSQRNLDMTHPMIAADLTPGALPVSALGYIFASCQVRMENKGQPFTLLSCDNLPGNGMIAQRVLMQFAEAKNPDVARWISRNVSFPNSMVDRITPAVTPETIALVAELAGIDDAYPVVSESFSQWIIEDNFINGRPQLEDVGVQFVDDVDVYEKMKVRLLNGSHSALSYVSYLLGYRDVDKAMADPLVKNFVQKYMANVAPTVGRVEGIDLDDYQAILIERFSNPAIADKILRLAEDGSEKIRNAMIPPLEMQRAQNQDTTFIVYALAAWCRFLCGIDENGENIPVSDPRAEELKQRVTLNNYELSDFFSLGEVFGEKLARDEQFMADVNNVFTNICTMGTRESLMKLLSEMA
jgi:mannitol 2-dehydrogenase